MTEHQKSLMTAATREIRALRQENQLLAAQVGVVNVFATALGMKRDPGPMSVDLCWEIERELEADKPQPEPNNQP